MPSKMANSLRDKLEDDVLDLSLMQLTEVPVKEIAELPKGTTLDLSNNSLTWLPENFPTLSHLIKLDLSKNQLTELPEYFGQLRNLRHLDLYSNQLYELPVSFSQLKSLKWLDLKNNPLNDTLERAAGPCITPSDCSTCAKKVVALMQSTQSHLERQRQKTLMHERRLAEERRQAEEAEQKRLRAEKKAAKEQRRLEAKAKAEALRREAAEANLARLSHEMERPRSHSDAGNTSTDTKKGHGCAWSCFMLMLGTAVVGLGFGISLLWIYTEGRLDQRSIERALPALQHDIDANLAFAGKRADAWLESARPYADRAQKAAAWLWADLGERNKIIAHKINESLGPALCPYIKAAGRAWEQAGQAAADAWASARPTLQSWAAAASSAAHGGWQWTKANAPAYYELALEKASELARKAAELARKAADAVVAAD